MNTQEVSVWLANLIEVEMMNDEPIKNPWTNESELIVAVENRCRTHTIITLENGQMFKIAVEAVNVPKAEDRLPVPADETHGDMA